VNGKQGRRYLPMGRLFRDEVGILRGFDACGEDAARVWRADKDCISMPSGFRCVLTLVLLGLWDSACR
jgi:hypothetical protein